LRPELSFEQAPPLDAPLRFFLAAPWFGAAAGALLSISGGEALASRWTPAALAATHLLVAGFMLQAMCGALLQFVPVATGGNVWRPRWVAACTHPVLIASASLLAAAFLSRHGALFAAAAYGFALALGCFGVVVGSALWRTPARGATLAALRIALTGLGATAALGIVLATGIAHQAGWPVQAVTDLHAAWGLGGWALILLAGVSFAVVPMFYLTPAYPAWLTRGLPVLALGLLLAWSARFAAADAAEAALFQIAGFGLGGLFAAATLRLQGRRRKSGDASLLFMRTAMLSLLALPAAALLFVALPELRPDPRAAVWLGVLALVGVFVSAINGMLYKIVPFLGWLHLKGLAGPRESVPTMRQIISERAMRGQFRLHLAALSMLLAAVWLPALARPAGLLFLLSCTWLGWNLSAAAGILRDFRNRIRANAGDRRS